MKEYKLSQLLEIKNGKDHKELPNGDYPVFGSGGVMRYVNEYLYDKPSILLPRKGSLNNIQYCDVPFWTVDTLYYTEVNEKIACPYYLYNYLCLLDLSGLDTGTGVPSMTFDSYYNIKVLIPEIEEQKRVASVLQNLDHKIALNRQINDNLEAMAKQLYDYWFVQFDFPNEDGKPYKSSGGAMVWKEKLKREIPQGWHCYELNKWLEIKSGFAFKSETYISKGKFKVVTIKNVQDHHLDTSSCDYVYEIPQGMKEWCSLSVNDRLISLTGNCGRLCIVTEKDLLLNQRVGLLACNDEYIDYAYLLLSSEEYQTLSNNLAKGAAQANLSPVDLCKNIAVLPKLDVLEKFNRQIKPIVASYIQNEIQIAELTKQRDELLPLLMNGQATVNYHLSLHLSNTVLYTLHYLGTVQNHVVRVLKII